MEFVNGFKITLMLLEERFVINYAKCLPECGGLLRWQRGRGGARASGGPEVVAGEEN